MMRHFLSINAAVWWIFSILTNMVSLWMFSSEVVAYALPTSTFPRQKYTVAKSILMMSKENFGADDLLKTSNGNSTISRTEAVRKMLRIKENDDTFVGEMSIDERNRRELAINLVAGSLLVACGVASSQLFLTNIYTPSGFRRLSSTQFIAAIGDPNASQGRFDPNDEASASWGLWRNDPGPRGVWLRDYDKIFGKERSVSAKQSSVPNDQQYQYPLAPAGWTFDKNDWWLEEHGIIMEKPLFPMPPGRYLVTGGRNVTTGLTIDRNGNWKLDEGTLFDITHLPCRSARYRPVSLSGSPQAANLNNFPVKPGSEMPAVPGCSKQDYAVLFLVGVATTTN
jgi:hypothetical protein